MNVSEQVQLTDVMAILKSLQTEMATKDELRALAAQMATKDGLRALGVLFEEQRDHIKLLCESVAGLTERFDRFEARFEHLENRVPPTPHPT